MIGQWVLRVCCCCPVSDDSISSEQQACRYLCSTGCLDSQGYLGYYRVAAWRVYSLLPPSNMNRLCMLQRLGAVRALQVPVLGMLCFLVDQEALR
jgi:hypothetical protein